MLLHTKSRFMWNEWVSIINAFAFVPRRLCYYYFHIREKHFKDFESIMALLQADQQLNESWLWTSLHRKGENSVNVCMWPINIGHIRFHCRNVLFDLLKVIGVPENCYSLLSPVTSTTSCVRCDGMFSDWFTIDSGVMQGYVLCGIWQGCWNNSGTYYVCC